MSKRSIRERVKQPLPTPVSAPGLPRSYLRGSDYDQGSARRRSVTSHLGRRVAYHSPAGSPQQGDPKVSAQDEADYQESMRQMKGQAGQSAQPAPPSTPQPDPDAIQIYKTPPANKGGYFRWPGSK